MKFNFKSILLSFFGFYFLIDPLREFLQQGRVSAFSFSRGWIDVYLLLTTLIPFFLFSLLAYAAFYYFFRVKKPILLVLSIIGAFTIPILVRFFFQEQLSDILFGFTNYKKGVNPFFYFRDNLYFGIMYVSLGIVVFVIEYANYKEKLERELVTENQKMELSLLRSQINPHFLLNSMNNIYSLVYQKSDKALNAVNQLSNILKYSLYENKEMVSLKEEVEYLNNYTDLQKMRYDYEPSFDFQIPKETLDIEVPQFLLIPLIENGFKHGELREQEHPLSLKISKEEGKLRVEVSNKKREQQVDEVGGIGLENVQKRLELLYSEKHTFEVKNGVSDFQVIITIPVQ